MSSSLKIKHTGYHNFYDNNFRLGQAISYTKKTKITYDFKNHFHPHIGFLIEKLSRESLEGLLTSSTQEKREEFFQTIYEPNSSYNTLIVNYQPKENDVSEGGAYAVYNWELFFHVPFTIAVHLSKNQRFSEAQKWFHYIFDPTSNDQTQDPPLRFWKFKAFRQASDVQLIDEILKALSSEDSSDLKKQVEASIAGWREKPFQPHAIARTRFVSYQFSVVMKYLDNLIAWGDSLFHQDTIETINEATQLYVLAANILGEKPQEIPRRGTTRPQTFATLKNKLDVFGNALVEMEGQFPFNLNLPSVDNADTERSNTLFGVGQSLYFCIPENTNLLGYWDTVADRLFKIRHCMNIEGIVRQLPLFQPPIDPGMLVKAAAAGIDISSVVSGLNQPISPIRSTLLIQKALEICSEVRSLGSNLLSALEKKDAEALSLLRQKQEIRMMELNSDVRLLQWKEAEANTDALLRSRETAFLRYKHYQMLLGKPEEDYAELGMLDVERKNLLEGMTKEEREASFDSIYNELITAYSGEITLEEYPEKEQIEGGKLHLNRNENIELNIHMPTARRYQKDATDKDELYGHLGMIPNFGVDFHFWGMGGHFEFGGPALAAVGRILAGKDRADADAETFQGTTASRTSTYERRAEDWTLQSNLAARELVQIGRQIISSLIREQITKKEYENQQQQLEHSREIDAFLKDKFTNQELYNWMHSELSKIYYDCYKFAYDIAKKTEQTMKFELMRPEVDDHNFIKFNYWDAGRKGLLSGESLYLDLKRMEMAYHEYNKREYELTKHISLRQLNSFALLQLKATGTCTVQIPEWVFDLDGPGHYMRRIKTVAVSIPAVAGPYTSVNCTLSLQKSTIRRSPLGDGYARDTENEDSRFVDYFGTIESIVTSSAQNDSGLFEVNLRDERFLPFENAGAESTWRIELPSENRQFDYNTISDVIIHIRYTARQGGAKLAQEATSYIKDEILADANQSGLSRLFSLKHDFPAEWHRFTASEGENFKTSISRDHFPYIAQLGNIELEDAPFELWAINEEQDRLEPVSFSNEAMIHNLDELNSENREGELEIVVELDKTSEYFFLVNYTLEF